MKLALLLLAALCCEVSAAAFYVTKSGDDTTGDGSIGNPWLTINKATDTVTAGNTILVGAGTYVENVRADTQSGSAGNPIIVDGQNVATVASWTFESPYYHLQNFTIAGGTNAAQALIYFETDADNCILSNNVIDFGLLTRTYGIRFAVPSPTPLGNAGSNNLIISNTMTRGLGMSIISLFGDFNRIHGNRLIDSDTVDWLRLNGQSNVISGNIFSNMYESGISGNHADFVQTFFLGGLGSMHHIIESNIVVKMDGAAQLGNLTGEFSEFVQGIIFRNNLFIGVSAKMSCAMPGLEFYNNVFIDCSTNTATGGHLLNFGSLEGFGSGDNARVHNNVFYRCGLATNTGWYGFDAVVTNISADYNFVSKTNDVMVRPNPLMERVGDPGGWESTEFYEDHGINGGNPLFVNVDSLDFRLQAGSPLVNTGTNLTFATDLAGVSRPQGAAWDIGAYEYESGGAPDPPSGLRLRIDGRVSVSGRAELR